MDNVINILVSYDMGWSRRGNGKSYDSLNGYGAIIGFLSGKILDFATRNRKCRMCEKGHPKEDHDCRLNFRGSAKAMEASVGSDLVNNSQILKEKNMNVKVLIGDDDSSTPAAIRKGNSSIVYKLSDSNHLRKNLSKDLYALQPSFIEMRNRETIPHIKKCFTYAVQQNKGQSVALAATLRSIPYHMFGEHEQCGSWCHRANPSGHSQGQKFLLKDQNLFENSSEFSMAASSQSNESLNNIMAHKAPKNCCYSLSESCDYRFASSVVSKNDGEKYLLAVQRKLPSDTGKNTASYVKKQENRRKRRVVKAKLITTKKRRNKLAVKREMLRKNRENFEGVQYSSNCGMEVDIDELMNTFEVKSVIDKLPTIQITEDNYNIIYFDLETSGLEKTADILQIAAKFEKETFEIYITPTRPINSSASEITGLKNVDGHLFYRGNKVHSYSIEEALIQFQLFINKSIKPCILVAHNVKFDSSLLLTAIIKNSMIENFINIVGFSDTLTLLKRIFLERKGPGLFKLEKLAKDLLPSCCNEKFHEASYDVHILEKLVCSFISKSDIAKNCKPYKDSITWKLMLPHLTSFQEVVSPPILKKIAMAGFTFNELQKLYVDRGEESIIRVLSTKNLLEKPIVTKDKRVLTKIISCLRR